MSRINVGRLETLTIVTTLLHMADRRTEQGGPVLLGNRQQGDFTVELDKLFDNQLFDVTTTAVAAIFPSVLQLVGTLHKRLSLAGRRHQRFHHTRETYFSSGSFQFV